MAIVSSRLQSIFDAIDAANAEDPRLDTVDGVRRPREVVYSERMTRCLARLYPGASESLQIGARAQHICRWQKPRDSFPQGRDGYNAWRNACRDHHASLTSEILSRNGFGDAEIHSVVGLIKKHGLKTNPESQALENVVGVVFAEFYLAQFVVEHADYDKAKLVGILKKTLRKMDAVGHDGILRLQMPEAHRRLIEEAF